MSEELHYRSLVDLAEMLRSRQISPVDVTKHALARIAALDGRLRSFIFVSVDGALAQAKTAEVEIGAGCYRGPLHGIPYGLKDVYATAGIPTTGNSPAFRDHVPTTDATVVARLHQAGAILLGKQATHEMTYGGVADDLPWPPPRNPWNLDRDTGGSSSGGGAAVAAGLCVVAMGTDTGGSVRNPAAHCGIVGLKPTYGRVSRAGVMMNSYSLDHCGVLSRTVHDAALVLEAVTGPDPADPTTLAAGGNGWLAREWSPDLAGIRIGVVRHFWERDMPANHEVRAAMEAALRHLQRLGAHLEEVRLATVEEYAVCKATIQMPEIYAEYRELLEEAPERFGAKFRARVMAGGKVLAMDYVAAQSLRRRLTAEMIEAIRPFDALVTAGPYGPAPRLTEVIENWQFNRPEITVPFSLTGFPAISICNGFTQDGLPLALQVVAAPFEEARLLRVAHAYQTTTEWHRRRPPL